MVAAGDERSFALGERGVEGALFRFVVESKAVLRGKGQIDAAALRFGIKAQRTLGSQNQVAADAFEVQRAERAGDIHLAARGFDLGTLRFARKLDRAGDGRDIDLRPCAVHHTGIAARGFDLHLRAVRAHHARIAAERRKLDLLHIGAHVGVGVRCFDFYLLKVTGADQFPRKSHVEVLFPVVAAAVSVAEEADAQRVAVDRADHLLALGERRGGFLLHADLRALLGGIDVHAAAAPRDVDLADVPALADAEHRACVEIFAPRRFRAEGVERPAAVVLRVPLRVHLKNTDARDQFSGVRSVVLPLHAQLFGLRLRVAPALLVPIPQDDGIGRTVAEGKRHGIEEGRRHRDGQFKDRGHVAADFVQRMRAVGDHARALAAFEGVVPVVAAAVRGDACALRVRHRQLR